MKLLKRVLTFLLVVMMIVPTSIITALPSEAANKYIGFYYYNPSTTDCYYMTMPGGNRSFSNADHIQNEQWGDDAHVYNFLITKVLPVCINVTNGKWTTVYDLRENANSAPGLTGTYQWSIVDTNGIGGGVSGNTVLNTSVQMGWAGYSYYYLRPHSYNDTTAGNWHDIVVYYQFTGGSGSSSSTPVKKNTSTTLVTPTKTGYTFEGWSYDSDSTAEIKASNTSAGPDSLNNYRYTNDILYNYFTYHNISLTDPPSYEGLGIELWAVWTANKYNITYKDQGNVTFSGTHAAGYPKIHTYGAATTLKSASKNGYTFGGWYTNSDCTGSKVTSLGATAYTSNITLYAKWEPASYTVTLNKNGGTINSGNVTGYTYGIGATLPTNVTKDNYTFAGWYANSGLTGDRVFSIGTTETGAKEYWAKWTPDTYAITYDANGGSGAPDNGTKTYNENYTIGAAPSTPPTYTVTYNYGAGSNNGGPTSAAFNRAFTYWYTNTTGTGGTSYAPGATYSTNAALSLHAIWGNATLSGLPTSSTITPPSNKQFDHWETAQGTTYANGDTISGDITLIAQYVDAGHTVTLNFNGGAAGTGMPSSFLKQNGVNFDLRTLYGDTISSGTYSTAAGKGLPTLSGRVFMGWASSKANADAGNADVTLITRNGNGYRTAYSNSNGSFTSDSITTIYAVWGYAVSLNQKAYVAVNGQLAIDYYSYRLYKLPTQTLALPTETSPGGFAGGTLAPGNFTALNGPNQTGMRLIGWFEGMDSTWRGTGTNYGASYTADAAATLYAVFGMPIVFDAGSGSYNASAFASDSGYLLENNRYYVNYVTGSSADDSYSSYSSIYPTGAKAPTRSGYSLYSHPTNIGGTNYPATFTLAKNINGSPCNWTPESPRNWLTINPENNPENWAGAWTKSISLPGGSVASPCFIAIWTPDITYTDDSMHTAVVHPVVNLADNIPVNTLENISILSSLDGTSLVAPSGKRLSGWTDGSTDYSLGQSVSITVPTTLTALWATADVNITFDASNLSNNGDSSRYGWDFNHDHFDYLWATGQTSKTKTETIPGDTIMGTVSETIRTLTVYAKIGNENATDWTTRNWSFSSVNGSDTDFQEQTYSIGDWTAVINKYTLYPKDWRPVAYTLTFDVNGGTIKAGTGTVNGSAPSSAGLLSATLDTSSGNFIYSNVYFNEQYSSIFTVFPEAERSGYVFAGWQYTDNSDSSNNFVLTSSNMGNRFTVHGDVVVTAIWVEAYTVTYAANAPAGETVTGTPTDSNGYSSGAVVTVLAAPTCANYDFLGWSDGANTYQPGATFAISANTTLTAQWRIKLKVAGANIELSDGINVYFYVRKALFGTDDRTWDKSNTAVTVSFVDKYGTGSISASPTYYEAFVDSEYSSLDYYRYCFNDINPAHFGEIMTVTLSSEVYGTAETATDSFTYSVAQYCVNMIEGSAADKVKQLCAAILLYGNAAEPYAQSQHYIEVTSGHSVLATADAASKNETKYSELTPLTSLISGIESKRTHNEKAGYSGLTANTDGFAWKGASLYLRHKIWLRVSFTYTGDINDLTITDGSGYAVDIESAGGSTYYAYVKGLSPADFSVGLKLTAKKSSTPISRTLNYSIDKYIDTALARNDGSDLYNLASALNDYGDAAVNYLKIT